MGRRQRRSVSEWQALVDAQHNSGLSVKAFCREQGLVDKTFYNQRNKLGCAPGSDGRVKLGFVKVQPSPSGVTTSSAALVLQYHSSRLELGSAASPTWLAELMKALP